MPNAAVVVPVYNGAPSLARCLDALVAGRPQGVPILVVDDGSTDGSADIAARYPVTLLRRPARGGASAARNTGVAATDADRLVFVDADVVVHPGAIAALLRPLDDDPDLLGVNGLLSLDLTTPGLVTAFTNTSLHYQLRSHGERVASAFTSLCVLRRDALVRMGGWDPRTSRFADDVGTRWALPPRSIALALGAQAEHLKAVRLFGLLRHRRQVGWHFVRSVADNWGVARDAPQKTVLAPRYPLNTLAAALFSAAIPLAPLLPGTLTVVVGMFVAVNLPFALFTLRRRGPLEAAIAIPISALEGFAYLAGMLASATTLARRSRVGTPAPPR